MIRMICSEDHVFLTFFNIEFPPVVQAFANAFCSGKVKKECLRCIFLTIQVIFGVLSSLCFLDVEGYVGCLLNEVSDYNENAQSREVLNCKY